MSITLSSASLPVFQTALSNLLHCLNKAEANAAARKFDPNVFVTARLAGIEAPKFEDNETTFAELQARVRKTLDWLATVPATAIDGREEAQITFPVGRDKTRTMTGEAYLKHWAIPNLFFHVTTAYALLRHNGVDLGKADYLAGEQAGA